MKARNVFSKTYISHSLLRIKDGMRSVLRHGSAAVERVIVAVSCRVRSHSHTWQQALRQAHVILSLLFGTEQQYC